MSTLGSRLARIEGRLEAEHVHTFVVRPYIGEWRGGFLPGYMAPYLSSGPEQGDDGRFAYTLLVVGESFAREPLRGLTGAQVGCLKASAGSWVLVMKCPDDPPESWGRMTAAEAAESLAGVPPVAAYSVVGQPVGYL